MPRTILHLDLDAFFCAVEEQHNPALRGTPFAVGGRPDQRGVVASCSYPARQFGVRSAMPMSQALRICPTLVVVSSRHGLYGDISQQVMDRLHALTPLVEQISIDEAFLDVSDLPEPGFEIARRLQAQINTELSLPCSIGVASNKLVAKIATDAGKHRAQKGAPPNAITLVPPGEEAAFLAPLPANALWGVGPKTAARLAELGIHTIGDLASWPADDLASRFGKSGQDLARRALGLDDSPVITSHEVKSISQEVTFARDVKEGEILFHTLRDLSEQVGRRLRNSSLSGATVRLKLRWPDFTTLTRQQTLPQPTDQDADIYACAKALFEKEWRPGKAVRLLGVGVSGFADHLRQLSLWESGTDRQRRLQAAVDELRHRYGSSAIRRGDDLEHDD